MWVTCRSYFYSAEKVFRLFSLDFDDQILRPVGRLHLPVFCICDDTPDIIWRDDTSFYSQGGVGAGAGKINGQ